MSMKDFEICNSAGSLVVRSFPIYTVEPRTRAYAVNPRTTPGSSGVVTIDGDRFEIPSQVIARIYLSADSIEQAVDLAYDVIEDARVAGSIRWYQQGQSDFPTYSSFAFQQRVNGIDRAGIEFDGPHVFLVLSFLPTRSAEQMIFF
jgi:hypothetical protein